MACLSCVSRWMVFEEVFVVVHVDGEVRVSAVFESRVVRGSKD